MNPFQMFGTMNNPQAFIQQMMNNSQFTQNPMIRNAIQMYQSGDTQGLQAMAENLCKERGTTPQQVQEMIKKQFGM